LGRSFLTSWPQYWQSLEFAQLKRLVGENVISMVGARAVDILQRSFRSSGSSATTVDDLASFQ
jgi:hypothetical protein